MFLRLEMANAVFSAIVLQSKRSLHPLLFHRTKNDQEKGYKFYRVKKVNNSEEHYYVCYNCAELKKNDERYAKLNVPTIRILKNQREFKTDPELYVHICEAMNYANVLAEQSYR